MRRMKIRAVPNMRPGGSQRTGQNRTAASSGQSIAKLPGIVKEEIPGNVPDSSAELEANAPSQSSEIDQPVSHTTADVIAQSIKLEKTSVKEALPAKESSPSTSQTSLSQISLQGNAPSQKSTSLGEASTQQDSLCTPQSDNHAVHVVKDTKILTDSQAEGSLGPPEEVKVKQEFMQKTAVAGENKSLASMRRKRLKVAPMVSTGRKGAITSPSVCEPSTSKNTVGSETIDRKIEGTLTVSQSVGEQSRDEQSACSQMEKDFMKNISKTEVIDICTEEKEFSQGGSSDTAKESEISIISEGIASGISGVVSCNSTSNDKSQDPQVKRVKFAGDTDVAHTSDYKPTDSEVVMINSDISPAFQKSSEERRNDESRNSLLKHKYDSKEGVQATECVESGTSQGSGTCIRRARIRAKPALSLKKRPPKKVDVVDVKKEPSTKEAEKVKDQPKEHEMSTAVLSLRIGDVAQEEPVTDRTETSVVQAREKTLKRETALATAESCEETISNQQFKRTDNSVEESKEFVLQQSKILEKNRQEVTQEERVRDQEDADSDDSCGDKENSSKGIKHIKKEVTAKSKSFKQSKGKLSQVGLTSPKIKQGKKIKGNDIDSKEFLESIEKKIFRERKEKFRKKLSKGSLEPKSMTMFDLIFFNPAANPMPGRSDSPKIRGRLNSKCETESVTSDILEEQKDGDMGLDASEPPEQSRPSTPEVQVCEENKEDLQKDSQQDSEEPEKNEEEEEEQEEQEEEVDTLAPRVKIGANRQIILDETSLKIRTTAAKNRDEILSKAEVVEESNDSSHYGKWSKKRKRSSLWTMKETARFYKALSTVGTDFSLMETLFAWRSRAELKTKFKKEERSNRALVDKALQDSTQFDFSLFDIESDYDPEEDRKACKEAEREEAKRRRLEIKQEEKARAKEEKQKIKAHKSFLRKKYKRDLLKKKKKKERDTSDEEEDEEGMEEEDIPYDDGNDPSSGDDAEMEESDPLGGDIDRGETSKLPKNEMKPRKKRKKRAVPRIKSERSPLEISEVTVTVETIKYNQPAISEEFVCEKTVAEDASEGSTDPIAVGHSSFATQETETDAGAEQKVWHFPISAIQTLEDGKQVVEIPTPVGPKIVPVPTLAPGTSNVIVMATDAPDSPGEHIYHVYLVSPLENA